MAIWTFPLPVAGINGDTLTDQIAAALGVVTPTAGDVDGMNRLCVTLAADDKGAPVVEVTGTDLDGRDPSKIAPTVAAHVPPPPPPTIAQQIAALPDPTVDLAGFKAGLSALLGA